MFDVTTRRLEMDIKKYEIFLNAVDLGGLKKASEEFGYTQSAISKMMNSLESEIGFPLTTRSNQGITLTPEGERALPMIRKLVEYNSALEKEFAAIRDENSGLIRIGTLATTGFIWMPAVLHDFNERFPDIQVETFEENSQKYLQQWLEKGIVEICLFNYNPELKVDWIRIRDDPYVALLPREHPLASGTDDDVVPVKKLFSQKMILFKAHEGLDKEVVRLMEGGDVTEPLCYTTNSDFTAIRMVAQNGFVTVLPEIIASYAASEYDVVIRRIDMEVSRRIGFAVKSADMVSPAARKFIQFIKNADIV